jgi:prevent-host-death family protein
MCQQRRINMINEVNAAVFRQNLGEMLNQVQYRHDSILIKKDGKPVAALVDTQLFDRIRRFKDRFEILSQRLAEAYSTIPEEDGLNEIDTIVSKTRHS